MTRHSYACHVRFSDVDVYGHVNNVKYFEYYQEARISFVQSLSGGLFDPGSSNRQVVGQIDVDYKLPLLFRPEPYAVETWVVGVGSASYTLGCRIVDEAGTEYSTAQVVLVAFDVAAGRSRALTDEERSRLDTVLEG